MVGTLFWLDKWVLDEPLSEKFPSLFAICDRTNALVAEIWNLPDARPNFRRSFGPAELSQWQALDLLLAPINLSLVPDSRFPGRWSRLGCFLWPLFTTPCTKGLQCSASRICGKCDCPLRSNISFGKWPEEGSLVGIKFRNDMALGMGCVLSVVKLKTKIKFCSAVCWQSSVGQCLVRLLGSSGLPSLFRPFSRGSKGSPVSPIICCGWLRLASFGLSS
jgi:hypothetical protein